MKAAKNIHSFTKYDHGLLTGMIRICDLRDFSNHPFKVVKDAAMYELMESIRQEGVLVPLLVRPIRMRTEKGEGAGKHMDEKEACHEENRYEIIAGHRRKTAAEWAGLREVPAIVRDLDDDQAVIAMVDSNLQRDHLLPSEKAYAYKMRLEAMKHQGKRLNLPMAQIEPKEESPSTEKNDQATERKVKCNSTKTGIASEGHTYTPIRSNELLARQVGENVNQIKRYIRLTFLIPQILKMVDEKRLALTSAVEISFLKEEEQYDLYAVMDLEQTVPTLSQANRMKRMSQQKGLTMDDIYTILEEVKPNQREQVRIPLERIQKYFPENFTPAQQVDLIEKLLAGWATENLK